MVLFSAFGFQDFQEHCYTELPSSAPAASGSIFILQKQDMIDIYCNLELSIPLKLINFNQKNHQINYLKKTASQFINIL